MDVIEVTALATLCAYQYYNVLRLYLLNKKRKPKRRRWWMTSIHRSRTMQTMDKQITELLSESSGEFENFLRMSFFDFEYLLSKVAPIITTQDTQLRHTIPPKVRLAITLRFLATGDSYKSLHFLFKISSQLISKIIPEVCGAINEALKDEVKIPSSTQEWLDVEKDFRKKIPHCVGAIDGKHLVLQCPVGSASEYYNYKKTFSIVLLALVDSNYRFIFAEIGSQGRISDGGVFRNSLLWQKICSNDLNLPTPSPLPGSDKNVPYVFIADGAFALDTHIMKPFPGNHTTGSRKRIFNQRLSSARVLVENAFGILSSKFRIFKKPIALDPSKASIVTMSCILLHNFLKRSETSGTLYTPACTVDVFDENGTLVQPGSWRNDIHNDGALQRLNHIPRRPTLNATQKREEFTSYFCTNSYMQLI